MRLSRTITISALMYLIFQFCACGKNKTENAPVPYAPSGLVAKDTTGGRIFLSWKDNSTDEKKFLVERSINNSTSFTAIAKLDSNTTSFIDDQKVDATNRFFRVGAQNINGLSDYSNLTFRIMERFSQHTVMLVLGILLVGLPIIKFGFFWGNQLSMSWSDRNSGHWENRLYRNVELFLFTAITSLSGVAAVGLHLLVQPGLFIYMVGIVLMAIGMQRRQESRFLIRSSTDSSGNTSSRPRDFTVGLSDFLMTVYCVVSFIYIGSNMGPVTNAVVLVGHLALIVTMFVSSSIILNADSSNTYSYSSRRRAPNGMEVFTGGVLKLLDILTLVLLPSLPLVLLLLLNITSVWIIVLTAIEIVLTVFLVFVPNLFGE